MSENFSVQEETIGAEEKGVSTLPPESTAHPAPTPPHPLSPPTTAPTDLPTTSNGSTTLADPSPTLVEIQDLCAWRDAIMVDLLRLDSHLKRTAVIAYIDTKLAGKGYDTQEFWSRPDTCARSTWNKWKKQDPVFTEVLTSAYYKAQTACTTAALDAVGQAQRILQLNSPQAAKNLVSYATGENFAKPEAQIRAATAVLDRASGATADKSPANLGMADVEIYLPSNDREGVDDEEAEA